MFINSMLGRRMASRPLMMPIRAFGGGGHEIVKADLGHNFIAECNKKTIVFDGLKGTAPLVH